MQRSLEEIVSDVWLMMIFIIELFSDWFSAALWAFSRWSFCFSLCFIFAWWTSLILCRMTRVINVSTICFGSASFKEALEGGESEGAGEPDEDDDDGAGERERDTWGEGERRRLRLLLAAASALTRPWRRVEAAIGSDGSSGANGVAVAAVGSGAVAAVGSGAVAAVGSGAVAAVGSEAVAAVGSKVGSKVGSRCKSAFLAES